MNRELRRLLYAVALIAPTIGAATWSSLPALTAAWAMLSFKAPEMSKEDWLDPARTLELRREIQKHFLGHTVYIPLEDIIAPPAGDNHDDLALLMQKACGRGRLYIWIPLRFKVPLTGEKVIEWCWRPQTKDV